MRAIKKIISLILSAIILFSYIPVVSAATDIAVSINLGTEKGTFIRMEQYSNMTGKSSDQYGGSLRDDDLAFMQANGLNGKIVRAWISLQDFYDSNGNYKGLNNNDISVYRRHLEDLEQYNEEIIACVLHPSNYNYTGSGWGPNSIRSRMAQVMTDLIAAYPKIKYVESCNEPDLSDSTYYTSATDYYNFYYKLHYESINIVNTNLGRNEASRIKIGGPISAMFLSKNVKSENGYYIELFIKAYSQDTAADKHLDFIAFHNYMSDKKGDPSWYGDSHPSDIPTSGGTGNIVKYWLGKYGLPTTLPVFITETGMYGGSASGADFRTDLFIEAAGLMTFNYGLIYNSGNENVYPFTWVPRHTQISNWRKNMLLTTSVSADTVKDKFTPFGNMYKMLGMLRDNRVATNVTPSSETGISNSSGLGVFSLGTKDANGVTAAIWNYQYNINLDASYNITTTVNGLNGIGSFSGKDVMVKVYRIDDYNGNYLNNTSAVLENSGIVTGLNESKLDLDTANMVYDTVYYLTPDANGSVTLPSFSFGANRLVLLDIVPIPDQYHGVLISKGKPAETAYAATSTGGGLSAMAALDGNPETRWAVPKATDGNAIIIDLEQVHQLEKIDIEWYKYDSRTYTYKIETSLDKLSWFPITSNKTSTQGMITSEKTLKKARYVRVTISNSSFANADASINELKIYGLPPNMALLKPPKGYVPPDIPGSIPLEDYTSQSSATASATNGGSPSNILDKNPTSYWKAPGAVNNHYITIDTGVNIALQKLDIDWYYTNSPRAYKYKIEVSKDNKNYITIIDKTSNLTPYVTSQDSINAIARFIRITITGCDITGVDAAIFDVRVWGIAKGSNLLDVTNPPLDDITERARVISQSTGTNNNFPASNVLDGNNSTRWLAANAFSGQNFTIDLGYRTDLKKIAIDWYYSIGARAYKYKIEGSNDGQNYVVLVDKTSNTTKATSTINDVSSRCRYIKVTVTGSDVSGQDASIFDMRAYGTAFGMVSDTIAFAETSSDNGATWSYEKNTDANQAIYAIDGDESTYWMAENGNAQRLSIDLGQTKFVSGVETLWYEGESGKNQRLYQYFIETSTDGINYTESFNGRKNKDFRNTISPIGLSVKFLRITVTGCSDNARASISEIKVNGVSQYEMIPSFATVKKDETESKYVTTLMDGKLTAFVDISNYKNGPPSMPVTVCLSLYDVKGSLITVKTAQKDIVQGNSDNIKVSLNNVPSNAVSVKIIVLTCINELTPYIEQQTLLK